MSMMPGLQGFGSIASQVTGNPDIGSVTDFVSQATQAGGIGDVAFNQLPGALGLDPTKQQLGQFLHALVSGQDPIASGARLIDDLGVLGDVSASRVHRGGQQLVDGNIGNGAENLLGAFGVNPSFGGFNPFDLIT